MAQLQALPAAPDAIRFLEPHEAPVVQATDLGSVQVLKHGNLYLLTDPFGDVHPDSRGLGLYLSDTRRLSCCVLRVGGQRPVLLRTSAGSNYRGSIQLTNPRLERNLADKVRPEEALATQKLGIWRHRLLTGEVLDERVRIVNYEEEPREVELELDLAADAADIFEVRGWTRPERGRQLPIAVTEDRVTFRYDGIDGRRRSTFVAWSEPAVRIDPVEPNPEATDPQPWVRASWCWPLQPGEARELRWLVWAADRNVPRRRRPPAAPEGPEAGDRWEQLFPPLPHREEEPVAASYRAWSRGITQMSTDNELFNLVLQRSTEDVRLLLNDGPRPGQRYVAAGVPWFTTLFGRDAIITSLQALCVRPQLAVETLEVLAAYQADAEDPERDAEPGKILHEVRVGEMARADEIPHRPYYGTVDATPLWLVLLGATFDWTGDRGLVDRLWPNALRALEWIDRWGDRDGDGFVEYARRTERGLVNQGWKDSTDGIRDRSGRLASLPIALVEVQGYVFDAKRRMAALARMRGEDELATRLESEAETLRRRFEEAFWIDDRGFYALALDGAKRPADAIGSNPGHCLWSGIVAPERSRLVAERLLSADLFSGWGVRTYAAGQPGYNPIGYHTGTVWPHDVSLIAAGLKRYGHHEEANLLVGRVFEAAQHFPDFRLPELFCGFDRDISPIPVPYPVACSPQAWAAAAPFLFLETMLGLHPHADRGELELVRPALPPWLSRVNVTGLRVGDGTADLLVHRWRGGTSAEVLHKSPSLGVTIRI